MPTNSSGPISLGRSETTTITNSVAHKLGYAQGATVSMNDTAIRSFAEVSTTSGVSYGMNSFLNKPTGAGTSTYDCSTLTGWTQSSNTDSGSSAKWVEVYNSIHWKFRADGNLVPYVYQTRRLDLATSFDIQFDVLTNQSGGINPVQIQIGANSSLASGGGFRYGSTIFSADSFTSSTHIGTIGSTLITFFNACNTPTGTNRVSLWTRLRFVATRSGTTWSGTVTAISLAPADSGTVLGSSAFSFTAAGNYIVVRSFADADGDGEACFIDSAIITTD